MNPVNPVNELNLDGLINRWFDAADKFEMDLTDKEKLYEDTKLVTSTLKKLIRKGSDKEAKELVDTILSSFERKDCENPYKIKLADPSRLIVWISQNSTRKGNQVKGAHKYFHSLFSNLKSADNNYRINFPYDSGQDLNRTFDALEDIDDFAMDLIREDLTPKKNVNIAEISDNIWLLEQYAEEGIKPFLDLMISIDSQPKVTLFGSVQSSDGTTTHVPLHKKHYKDSLNLTNYFYEFLQESIAKKDLTLESAVNILLDLNDAYGVKKLLSNKTNGPLNEKLLNFDKIFKKGPEFIEVLMDYLPANELTVYFHQAQIRGDIDTQTLFILKNFPVSDFQKELYESQKKWFENKAEDQIPALKYYNAERQIFKPKHKIWYLNNNKGQEFYLHETTKSVKFALFVMNEMRGSKDNSHKFEILLTSLGFRRGCIAYQSESLMAESFGKKRDLFHLITIELYGQEYVERAKNLMSNGIHFVFTTINGMLYVLTQYKILKNVFCTFHNHDFWSPDDPVFREVSNLFDHIIKIENATADELKMKIASFHWLMANIIPFDRGSASISEVLTDALWLLHGFIPQRNLEKGKTIDMEAILSPALNSFQAIYPSGVHYLSK